MKQIIVKSCGECPYLGRKHGGLYCKKIAEVHQNEVGFDTMHPSCPLVEMPDKEEAMIALSKDFNQVECEMICLHVFGKSKQGME